GRMPGGGGPGGGVPGAATVRRPGCPTAERGVPGAEACPHRILRLIIVDFPQRFLQLLAGESGGRAERGRTRLCVAQPSCAWLSSLRSSEPLRASLAISRATAS